MSDAKLSPCPFCGVSNAIAVPRAVPVVECFECGAECFGETIGAATDAWNKRAVPELSTDDVDRVVHSLWFTSAGHWSRDDVHVLVNRMRTLGIAIVRVRS